MFTFKKIALIGVAGLAAFSISCSDDSSGAIGGEINGLGVTQDKSNLGIHKVTGEVKANAGNEIATITVAIKDGSTEILNKDGTKPVAATSLVDNATSKDTISLTTLSVIEDNLDLSAITTDSVELSIEVTATFKSDDPTSDTKPFGFKIAVPKTDGSSSSNNGSSSSQPEAVDTLVAKTLEIFGTGAGGSFVDLDGDVVYRAAEVNATTGATIDIVYAGGLSAVTADKDFIYSTYGIDAARGTTASPSIDAITGASFIVDLTEIIAAQPEYQALLAADKIPLPQIAGISAFVAGEIDEDRDVEKVSAAVGSAFAVQSTDGLIYLVAVTEKDGLVSLNIKYFPTQK